MRRKLIRRRRKKDLKRAHKTLETAGRKVLKEGKTSAN